MQAQSKLLNGIKGTNFDVRLEYNKDYMIVHLPLIEKMSKETFQEMSILLEDWYTFFKDIGYKGLFAVVEPESKIEKLAKMLKFEYVGRYEEKNVLVYKEQ